MDPLRRSVVKLFTVIKKPDHFQPWTFRYQRNSGGSGFILEHDRIMTNAHVISDQVYVQVLKTGDSKKYAARVEYVDHDSELAILRVEEPSFFEGTVPVTFGELPLRQAKVAVYGFPVGGNELCVTEGVVSRIEVRSYTHSQRRLLAVQTDAAINPGNSGGPVFMDGRLVGVAFQSHKKDHLEKSGYIVPVSVIRHFLADIEDGKISGVPELGIYWQKIESDNLRDYLHLDAKQSGVLITRVVHGGSAHGMLEEGDVLTAIGAVRVECDGSILLREDDRVAFWHLINERHVGDEVTVDVLRNGKVMQLPIVLQRKRALVPGPQHDTQPTYFIHAGLVFTPLSYDFLACWDWKDVDPRFKYLLRDGLPNARRRQIVLINQVLAHDVNAGYHQVRGAIVDRVNNVAITEIQDVVRAMRSPLGKYHVIEIDYHAGHGEHNDFSASSGTRIVINAERAARAADEILGVYGVANDRSSDLIGL